MRILYILLALLCLTQQVFAGVKLEAVYPYNLDKSAAHVVHGGSTMPLFINITGFDVPHEQPAHLRVILPEGFKRLPMTNGAWEALTAARRRRQIGCCRQISDRALICFTFSRRHTLHADRSNCWLRSAAMAGTNAGS